MTPQRALLLGGQTFTSTEIARIAGVSLRQLQWWDERKLISPGKQGRRRAYLAEDVIRIMVVAELRRKGCSLARARQVVRFLQREMPRRPKDFLSGERDLYLLTDGKSVYLEERQERVLDLLKDSRQPMFLISVSDQARRLAEMRQPRQKSKLRREAQDQLHLF
jgi:DNA-binding transcriptional MerR regulator